MSESILVYDDDCGFCTWWADLLAERTDLTVLGFSALPPDVEERLPDAYEQCAHVLNDDVYSCGRAVEEAVLRTELGEELRPGIEFARRFDLYPRLRERAYRWVAGNRSLLGSIVSKPPPGRETER